MNFKWDERQKYKEQADEVLRALAKLIVEEDNKKLSELETELKRAEENGELEPFPEDLKKALLDIVRFFEEKSRNEKRKIKFSAVICLLVFLNV